MPSREDLLDDASANLSRLSCTRIVITHRLTAVRNSDQILVLEGDEIVERGAVVLESITGRRCRRMNRLVA